MSIVCWLFLLFIIDLHIFFSYTDSKFFNDAVKDFWRDYRQVCAVRALRLRLISYYICGKKKKKKPWLKVGQVTIYCSHQIQILLLQRKWKQRTHKNYETHIDCSIKCVPSLELCFLLLCCLCFIFFLKNVQTVFSPVISAILLDQPNRFCYSILDWVKFGKKSVFDQWKTTL